MPAVSQEFEASIREFELYPEGMFIAQIVDVESETGQYGPQFKFKIDLPDVEREDGQPANLFYWTGKTISSKSNLGKMLISCRRPLPEAGSTFSVKGLIGEWIQARLVHKQNADGTLGCKISELLVLTPKQRKELGKYMPGIPLDEPPAEVPAAAPQAAVPVDEALPRMRLRKQWDLLARKAAVVDFTIGAFPDGKTDAEIAGEMAAHKKVLTAMEEEAEAEAGNVDPFAEGG